ncbi:MAG: hypothetical protein A2Y98_00800 [Candidatus Portnoybacteria bacterium RBG_19FT_COMBO_36_7]|uniref:SIMPL domain-containing protein n=1 Tax=Candidatus Portnoybacteria bacterium RBG_19FT_COMBO_36_7 TaxID=1801992 RepID=A0A1G2F7F0_9BACT|nr:MAG: hypothetical protein A2Y98_00800 [Candidatus Portnoybacteria bacterium RBG_19FT_COMBO_36_7]
MLLAALFAVLIVIVAVFMIFAAMNEYKKGGYIGLDVKEKNSITISGEGKIFATPDIGVVDLGVVSEANTVAAAQKDNVTKMNKITQAMKDLGVEEKDLKTTNYNISLRYQYNNYYNRSDIIGYEVNQTLEVKIRDLDKVGDIIAKAAELGANQVGSLAFTFDDPEKLNQDARIKAIANAKEKADTLSSSLGVKLVRIINFSESSYIPPTPYYSEKALGIGGGGASTPDIQTGQNEVTSSVTIVYEIQ